MTTSQRSLVRIASLALLLPIALAASGCGDNCHEEGCETGSETATTAESSTTTSATTAGAGGGGGAGGAGGAGVGGKGGAGGN